MDRGDDVHNRECDEEHQLLKDLCQCLVTFVNEEGDNCFNLLTAAARIEREYNESKQRADCDIRELDRQILVRRDGWKRISDQYKALVKSLSELDERVQEAKMTITILGHTSAGKSTILNCLIGADLLPCSMGHTTPCPTIITSTDGTSSYETESGHQKGDLPSLREADLNHLLGLKSTDILRVFLSHIDCKDTVLKIRSLKIVDHPGWNADTFEDSRKQVTKADATVFVMDCETGPDEIEIKKHLERLKQSLKASRDRAVLLVFNKLDERVREGKDTLENIVAKNYETAKKFLINDSGFLDATADVREMTFIFSAKKAILLRNTDRMVSLRHALEEEGGNLGSIVILGGPGVGKTSLCNELLRSSTLPVSPNSARCWVVCKPPVGSGTCWNVGARKAAKEPQPLTADQRLENVLKASKKDVITVYPATDHLKAESILYKCDQLVDSPSTESKKFDSYCQCLGEAHSVIIIVSFQAPDVQHTEEQIRENVKLIKQERGKVKSPNKKTNQKIFLVVNLWENSNDDHGKLLEQKVAIRSTFVSMVGDLQPQEKSKVRVFFISVKDSSDKERCASTFDQFESRLLDSANNQYIELTIAHLKAELVEWMANFMKVWSDFKEIQEACTTLENFKDKMGDSEVERERFAERFLKEYTDQISKAPHENENDTSNSRLLPTAGNEDAPAPTGNEDAPAPTGNEDAPTETQRFVPQTEKEKEEKEVMVSNFFKRLLSERLGDGASDNSSGDSLVMVRFLRNFAHRSEAVRAFIRSHSKLAEDAALQRLREMKEAKKTEVLKKARWEFRKYKLLLICGVGAGVGAGAGAAAGGAGGIAANLITGAAGGGAAAAAAAGGAAAAEAGGAAAAAAAAGGAAAGGAAAGGAAVIALPVLLAGASGLAVVGGVAAGITCGVLYNKWPDFEDDQEVKQFLKIYHEKWLLIFEEMFHEELHELAKKEAAGMKEDANRLQATIEKFQTDFQRLKKRVPERACQFPLDSIA